MKLTIVKNVEFPKDVSEDYRPTWEVFKEMRAVNQLRMFSNAETAIPECFRMLLNQAGARIKLRYTVKDHIDPKDIVRKLKNFLQRSAVLDHMRTVSHKHTTYFSEVESVCALFNPRFEGTVVLRAQRFDLKYLIARMKGLAYRELPASLAPTRPDGSPRKFKNVAGLKDADYAVIFQEPDLVIKMARTEKELVLKYEAKPGVIVPLYQRVDVALKNLWRASITGVF